MDFGALPPEINSARMYAGPGSTPMVAAAAAWNSMGAELATAASSYQSVISALTEEEWLGPASAAMATASAPLVTWLNITAAAAEHAAGQAMASAAAYEAAFAMTVPPPVIAANRAQLTALVATNFLGLNTAAIAATEALYAEMWAQDAAAMYGYAGSSASAGVLTPLNPPAAATNPAGPAGQTAAVGQADAGNSTQTGLSQLVSGLPNAVQGLASPAQASDAVADAVTQLQNVAGTVGNVGAWNMFAGISAAAGLSQAHAADGLLYSVAPTLGAAGLMGSVAPAGPAAFGGAPVLVSAGQASSVGSLSVPASWSAATPATAPATATLAGAGWTAAAEESTAMTTIPAGMPAMASAGRGGFGFGMPRYGFKPTVMTRPVVAG